MSGTLALDLDGTLLDCRVRQVALAGALAPGLDGERFWQAKRAGATTRAALERLGVSGADAIARRWTERIEDDEWLALDPLLPGTQAVLDGLRAGGWTLVVVTARRRADAVRGQAERLGLTASIGAIEVVDPADAARAKAPLLRACGASAFVGDTESDAAAAERAGVRFLAVGCGQRSEEQLAACGVAPVHADLRAAVRAL